MRSERRRESSGGELSPALVHAQHEALVHVAPDLAAELEGIAEGSRRSLAEIVAAAQAVAIDSILPDASCMGEVTCLYVDGPRGPVLGQTFDVECGALVIVRIATEVEQLVVTVPGCLGLFGFAASGVAVGVARMYSTEARLGTSASALVRACVREPDATSALARLLASPPASAHHVMVGDGRDFHGVESNGARHVPTQHGARTAHVHTNHAFDPVIRQSERVPTDSTTFTRMEVITTAYAQERPRDGDELLAFLRVQAPDCAIAAAEIVGGTLRLELPGASGVRLALSDYRGPTSAEVLLR